MIAIYILTVFSEADAPWQCMYMYCCGGPPMAEGDRLYMVTLYCPAGPLEARTMMRRDKPLFGYLRILKLRADN